MELYLNCAIIFPSIQFLSVQEQRAGYHIFFNF